MTDIPHNLKHVLAEIEAAARVAGRSAADITLVAVSKMHPRSLVEEAMAAGQSVFGENKIQEAEEKYAEPLPGAELHMVGHLQSNKTKSAAALFQRIHSIDKVKTARRLDMHLAEEGRTMAALVQVNVGKEPQKFGVREGKAAELVAACLEFEHLRLDGLMTMPPFFDDPELTRPYFRRLREIRDELNDSVAAGRLTHLSMGMSGDFRIAIEEGSTMVRIGTAVFGERDYSA